ncbi:MAG: Crp/Fnr family transcriptional regulator [Caulobacteraceae bacterium]
MASEPSLGVGNLRKRDFEKRRPADNRTGKIRLSFAPEGDSPLFTRNYILRALSAADRAMLEPDLVRYALASGEILYEPDYQVDWVWFPLTAVLSVVTVMSNGRTVESDTIGRESAVGILAALGKAVSTSRTITQIPGEAIRLPAIRLRRAAEESPRLRQLLVRHALANLAQAHQSVACNALHDVGARVCRWLLMSQDRTASDTVRLTQQYLAFMVGVQRTTITHLLAELAGEGLIAKHRGRIDILDRAGLEARVCECYAAVQSNLERLIGEAPTTP